MFKFKSVVFFVCIIAICGVFGKNTLRKAGPGPNGGSTSTNTKSTTTTTKSTQTSSGSSGNFGNTNPPPQVLDNESQKPTPLDGEIHKFKNLLADYEGEEQELREDERAEDFDEFVEHEFERSEGETTRDGKIDLKEYENRLRQVQQRYFVDEAFITEAINAFDSFNEDNEGESKDVLDEEEFAELIHVAIETLLPKIEALKGKPLEKVFNLRAFLEDLRPRPNEQFPCDLVHNDKDAAEFIKHVVERIPLKSEVSADLVKDLNGETQKSCEDLQKVIGDRIKKLVKPIEDALKKASDEAGLKPPQQTTAFLKVKKTRKGRKGRKGRKN